MVNPNRATSEEVLRRLKKASYERMRVELLNSIESKMRDFNMSWDDLGRLLGMKTTILRNLMDRRDVAKYRVIQKQMTLAELNDLAHLFSCEPYIIFRPRDPWIKT